MVEHDVRAALHIGQGDGIGGVAHRRLLGQEFHQPLGGSGGAQQVAEHLGQRCGGAGHEADIEHGLPQRARAHAALHHRHGAEVQAVEQRAKQRHDDEGGEQRAHLVAADGGLEGGLRRVGKAPRFVGLARIALHHGHGGEHFGGDGAGVGNAILAGARQAAHPAADQHGGQDHDGNHHQHAQHQARIGGDQHGHAADQHHHVAQPHGETRAHHGLYQRGVGGEARDHFAGLGMLEKLRTLPQHMGIDRAAHVGGDALAQPAHHVEARRGKHAQRQGQAEQPGEMPAQRRATRLGTQHAGVDQPAQGQRKGQRAAGGEQQKQQGDGDASAIRPQKRQ
ncbi:hypothetical protein GALL_547750 [mine drainage metagenome]|uniref:Uncharacterized protein n=1 Tax=mine drainage metagenome TaxID=410659 RepID=A0A1J5P8A2_9ZZZZ